MVPLRTTERSPVGCQDLISNVTVWPASKKSACTWNVQTCVSSLVTGLGSPAPSWILTVPLLFWPPAANASWATPKAAARTATTAKPNSTFILDVRNLAIPFLPFIPSVKKPPGSLSRRRNVGSKSKQETAAVVSRVTPTFRPDEFAFRGRRGHRAGATYRAHQAGISKRRGRHRASVLTHLRRECDEPVTSARRVVNGIRLDGATWLHIAHKRDAVFAWHRPPRCQGRQRGAALIQNVGRGRYGSGSTRRNGARWACRCSKPSRITSVMRCSDAANSTSACPS